VITLNISNVKSTDHFKVQFYRCFNVVYCRVKYAVSELVGVHLFTSVCLPIVLYASEATTDNLINRSLFRLFGCPEVSDLQFIRNVMDLLPVEVVMQNRRRRFSQFYNTGFCWADLIIHNNDMMSCDACMTLLLSLFAVYLCSFLISCMLCSFLSFLLHVFMCTCLSFCVCCCLIVNKDY